MTEKEISFKKVFLFLASFFLLAQFFGLFVCFNLSQKISKGELRVKKIDAEEFSPLTFLIAVFVLSVFLWFLTKFSFKRVNFFKALFFVTIFFGFELFLEAVGISPFFAIFLTLALIFLWLKKPYLLLHNFLLISAIAGVGAVLGITTSSQFVLSLFFLLSIYDLISVLATRHLVKVAEAMIESRAVLGVIVPQKFSFFFKKLSGLSLEKGKRNFFVLGAGDLIFPLFLSSSLYQEKGALGFLLVSLFSLFGLFLCFFTFLRFKKRPLPALPFLFVFSLLAFLLIKVLV